MHRFKMFGLAVLSLTLLLQFTTGAFAQDEAIAEAVAETEMPAQADANPIRKARPLTVAASLVDNSVITGTLIDSTAITMKTAFGEASIPLSEVAGIRFPAKDDSSTTVVMLNGDSITGATDLKFANVETTWGSAKINGQNISAMLFVPGLRWEPTQSLAGKRWNLIEATSTGLNGSGDQNPVQQASGVRPAGGNAPINSQPQIIYGR